MRQPGSSVSSPFPEELESVFPVSRCLSCMQSYCKLTKEVPSTGKRNDEENAKEKLYVVATYVPGVTNFKVGGHSFSLIIHIGSSTYLIVCFEGPDKSDCRDGGLDITSHEDLLACVMTGLFCVGQPVTLIRNAITTRDK